MSPAGMDGDVASRWSRFWSRLLDVASELISLAIAIWLLFAYQFRLPAPSSNDLAAGILAILSLLSISLLLDRFRRVKRIQELVKENTLLLQQKVLHRVRAEEFFVEDEPARDEDFLTANTILVSGITLGSTIVRFANVLRQQLQQGATIKILLPDFDSTETLEQIVARSWGKTSVDFYKDRINITQRQVAIIGETLGATGDLILGKLNYVPSFGLIILEESDSRGQCFVEIYTHHADDPLPTFHLVQSRDHYWYDQFRKQFDLMWETAQKEDMLNRQP